MKTIVETSYFKMWNTLENSIVNMAFDQYMIDIPEARLFSAIIIQAAKDNDSEYFNSEDFEIHSSFLRLSSRFLRKIIYKVWNFQKQGNLWIETLPLLEDDY